MKRFLTKRKGKAPQPIENKPHFVTQVEEKKADYPESAIAEYRKLGKRPYRNGQLTQTFKTWYDSNHT